MVPGRGAEKGACTLVVRTAMRDRLQHRGEGVRREHVLRLRNPSRNSTHVPFPAVFRDRVSLSAWMRFGAFPNRTCKIRRATSSSRGFAKRPGGRWCSSISATDEPETGIDSFQLRDHPVGVETEPDGFTRGGGNTPTELRIAQEPQQQQPERFFIAGREQKSVDAVGHEVGNAPYLGRNNRQTRRH